MDDRTTHPGLTLPAAVRNGDVVDAAQQLLGWELLIDGVGGRIVETEAYAPDDPASHAFRGRTRRNAAMFASAGTLYVYRSYGIHWCLNVVCGPEEMAAAVLVRALAPTRGLGRIAARRSRALERDWCRGPGRVGLALGADGSLDGIRPGAGRLQLCPGPSPEAVLSGPRVGITRAVERPWRFASADDLRLVSATTGSLHLEAGEPTSSARR